MKKLFLTLSLTVAASIFATDGTVNVNRGTGTYTVGDFTKTSIKDDMKENIKNERRAVIMDSGCNDFTGKMNMQTMILR